MLQKVCNIDMTTAHKTRKMSDIDSWNAATTQRGITASKAARAAGAIIFFGIPAVALTTALLGYSIRSLYKRIKQ